MSDISFADVMLITDRVSSPAALQNDEAYALYCCCLLVPAGGIVVETGCQLGRSSSLILQMAKARGFHSIHIDPYEQDEAYIVDWVTLMRSIHYPFTFMNMRTEQAGSLLSRIGQIDLAFIDGDHEALPVSIDMVLVAGRVKPGGYLTAHDYANEGLAGVKESVNKYVALGGWQPGGVHGSLGVWRRSVENGSYYTSVLPRSAADSFPR